MNQAIASTITTVPSPALLSSTLASTPRPVFLSHNPQMVGSVGAEVTTGDSDRSQQGSSQQSTLEETLLDMAASISSLHARVEDQGHAMATMSDLSNRLSGVQPPIQNHQSTQPPMQAAGLMTLPAMGVTLAEPVHMVPPYVAEMAISGNFMDLVLLLPRNLPLLPTVKPSDADLEKLKKPLHQLNTYESWLEAFVAYISLVVFCRPDKVIMTVPYVYLYN